MSRTLLEEVTQKLREMVLAGVYAPGEKLREVVLAREVDASRTVVRLALAKLEQEGLIEGQPNRGFSVRSFTIAQVAQAIEVRGTLEGMAARLCAENGLPDPDGKALSDLLSRMDSALADGFAGLAARSAWIEMNAALHDRLLRASGNATLATLVEQLSRIPLASARAIVFDAGDEAWSANQLTVAHEDHHAVVDAIRRGQGTRAEALMREHAMRSCKNKLESFDAMKSIRLVPSLPGLSLVRNPEDAIHSM